jgi:hypothetical protein
MKLLDTHFLTLPYKTILQLFQKLNLWGIVVLLVCSSMYAKADEPDSYPLGAWYIYNGFFNFSPTFELFVESQLRTWEVFDDPQVFFFRPYFNFNVAKNFQAGLGLEYHMNWPYPGGDGSSVSGDRTDEFRTTIQAMLFQSVGRVSIQHRYRYEFRFLDEKGKQRTRYRIQLAIPLTKPKIEKGTLFATLGNEIMMNTQPDLSISQNRTYVYLGYQFTPLLNFQFGYMYLAFPSGPGQHRLHFFLTHKLFFYDR